MVPREELGSYSAKQVNINIAAMNHIVSTSLDALSVAQLTHIILDISYQDAKKRSLFDIPEARDDVFKYVLGAPKVQRAIKEGKIQVVLF